MLAYLEDNRGRKRFLRGEQGHYLIGRDSKCHIRFPHKDTRISAEQAIVVIIEDAPIPAKYALQDRSRLNTTYVNGEKLRAAQNRFLKDLDKISFGSPDDVFFVFKLDESSEMTEVAAFLDEPDEFFSNPNVPLPPTMQGQDGEKMDLNDDMIFSEIRNIDQMFQAHDKQQKSPAGYAPALQNNPQLQTPDFVRMQQISMQGELSPDLAASLSFRLAPVTNELFCLQTYKSCSVLLAANIYAQKSEFAMIAQELRGLFYGTTALTENLREIALVFDRRLQQYNEFCAAEVPICADALLLKIRQKRLEWLNMGHHLPPFFTANTYAKSSLEELNFPLASAPLGLNACKIPDAMHRALDSDYLLMLFSHQLPFYQTKEEEDIPLSAMEIKETATKILEKHKDPHGFIDRFCAAFPFHQAINLVVFAREHQRTCPTCKTIFRGNFRFCPHDATPLQANNP